MKSMSGTAWIALCAVPLFFAVTSPVARGQEMDPADMVEIRRFNALGRRQQARTPIDLGRGGSRRREWVQIETLYEVRPEWMDELTFRYFVMSSRDAGSGQRPQYSFFQRTVRYADVREGRDRRSTVFLRPAGLERFGEVVAAAVEILYQGNVIGSANEENVPFPEGEVWYRNTAVLDSDVVTERDGYLLNRAETPWALVNIDDYEYIVP